MPVFYKWDGVTRRAGESVTIDKKDVVKIADKWVRNSDGASVPCAYVLLKNGQDFILSKPAGEVQDRLNDDYASAPDPEEILADESSSRDDGNDYLEDDDEEEE